MITNPDHPFNAQFLTKRSALFHLFCNKIISLSTSSHSELYTFLLYCPDLGQAVVGEVQGVASWPGQEELGAVLWVASLQGYIPWVGQGDGCSLAASRLVVGQTVAVLGCRSLLIERND